MFILINKKLRGARGEANAKALIAVVATFFLAFMVPVSFATGATAFVAGKAYDLPGVKQVSGVLMKLTCSKVVKGPTDVIAGGASKSAGLGSTIFGGIKDAIKGGGDILSGLTGVDAFGDATGFVADNTVGLLSEGFDATKLGIEQLKKTRDFACKLKNLTDAFKKQGLDKPFKAAISCTNWDDEWGAIDRDESGTPLYCLEDEPKGDKQPVVPPWLIPIYQQAGARYNVPWPLLAAINQNDTEFGAKALKAPEQYKPHQTLMRKYLSDGRWRPSKAAEKAKAAGLVGLEDELFAGMSKKQRKEYEDAIKDQMKNAPVTSQWQVKNPKKDDRVGWIPMSADEWKDSRGDFGGVPLGFTGSPYGRAGRMVNVEMACPAPVGNSGMPGSGDGKIPPYPGKYPDEKLDKAKIAQWMGQAARANGMPPELPVMAALVESNLRTNLTPANSDADSGGFFQMRTSIWDKGPYKGYMTDPVKQVKWFIDQAKALAKKRGGYPKNSSEWGLFIADVERPAAQYRGRYQLKLGEARKMLGAATAAAGDIDVLVSFTPDGEFDTCDPVDSVFALAKWLSDQGAAGQTWQAALDAAAISEAMEGDKDGDGENRVALDTEAAIAYAKKRDGDVGFSYATPEGEILASYRGDDQVNSASITKAMVLVAVLKDRDKLSSSDKSDLEDMITNSGNASANRMVRSVGGDAIDDVADAAKMTNFDVKDLNLGGSTADRFTLGFSKVTPNDQARLFAQIEKLMPAKYRSYGMELLRSIKGTGQFGILKTDIPGDKASKGGWRPEDNGKWTINQAAQIKPNDDLRGLAVLTKDNPSQEYGMETVKEVAERLLPEGGGEQGTSTGSGGTSQTNGAGKFTWPTKMKTIISGFGPRSSPGGIGSTNHKGIDIPVGVGTKLFAVADGKVAVVQSESQSGGYGIYTCIDHGSGISSCYAHQSDPKVKTGDEVSQGDVIGLSGNTGNSTGPHLHFEILKNGRHIDPVPILKGAKTPEGGGPGGSEDDDATDVDGDLKGFSTKGFPPLKKMIEPNSDRFLRSDKPLTLNTGLAEAEQPAQKFCRSDHLEPTKDLVRAYQAAGKTFNVDWRVLASVVERQSMYGCHTRRQGDTEGWVGFNDDRWRDWGVDANADGKASRQNALDSVFALARFLAARGAPKDYRDALMDFSEGNEGWVADILAVARSMGAGGNITVALDDLIGVAVQARDHEINRDLCKDEERYVDCIARLYRKIETNDPNADSPVDMSGPVGDRIVELARAELKKKVREQPAGSNESPDIRRYRKATAGGEGCRKCPWCAFFTSYIAKKAGAPLYFEGKGHGAVRELERWARDTKQWIPKGRGKPAPGDLIVFHTGSWHIGIVETVKNGKVTSTIEGNSKNAITRHGPAREATAAGFIRLKGAKPDDGGSDKDSDDGYGPYSKT